MPNDEPRLFSNRKVIPEYVQPDQVYLMRARRQLLVKMGESGLKPSNIQMTVEIRAIGEPK